MKTEVIEEMAVRTNEHSAAKKRGRPAKLTKVKMTASERKAKTAKVAKNEARREKAWEKRLAKPTTKKAATKKAVHKKVDGRSHKSEEHKAKISKALKAWHRKNKKTKAGTKHASLKTKNNVKQLKDTTRKHATVKTTIPSHVNGPSKKARTAREKAIKAQSKSTTRKNVKKIESLKTKTKRAADKKRRMSKIEPKKYGSSTHGNAHKFYAAGNKKDKAFDAYEKKKSSRNKTSLKKAKTEYFRRTALL